MSVALLRAGLRAPALLIGGRSEVYPLTHLLPDPPLAEATGK